MEKIKRMLWNAYGYETSDGNLFLCFTHQCRQGQWGSLQRVIRQSCHLSMTNQKIKANIQLVVLVDPASFPLQCFIHRTTISKDMEINYLKYDLRKVNMLIHLDRQEPTQLSNLLCLSANLNIDISPECNTYNRIFMRKMEING